MDGRTGVRSDRLDSDHAPRSPRSAILLLTAVGLFMIAISIGLSQWIGPRDGAEHLIVIPEGTAQQLEAGIDVELFPSEVRYRLRDQLIVVNEDVVGHQVGPFRVEPGQRLEQRFSEVATIQGFCSLHPGGEITINIDGT
ncbi:MAG: hypothetical protein ACI8TP_002602 [Acidimicrobiales bacterium]